MQLTFAAQYYTNIQKKEQMQVKSKIRDYWAANLERGDVSKLAKITGKSHSTISRLITGNIQTASSEIVLQINAFAKKRKIQVRKAESIDDLN